MATVTAATFRGHAPSVPASRHLWIPAYSLWRRELVRFYRQKARVVGVIASPLLFWVVLGSGFAKSFRPRRSAAPIPRTI